MWHEMSVGALLKLALKLLSASLVAFLCSLAIAMAIGHYIPRVYGTAVRPEPGRIYTWEELQKADKEARARAEELRRQLRSQSFREVVRELKLHALWGIWVPWLLLPLVTPLKTFLHFAIVMTVPIAAALLPLVPVEELFVITIAIAVGALSRQLLARRKHAT